MFIDKEKIVSGKKIWNTKFETVKELKPLCRKLAAEGSVLLKNDNVLPFKKGTKVALFGRTQENYIKSGTGSGGLVNSEEVPSIWKAFESSNHTIIDQELIFIYKEWINKNPYNESCGWGNNTPWCQKEMPISSETVFAASKRNDAAVVFIGRIAGESNDNANVKGSYYLTDDEKKLIEKVSSSFKKVVLVLNVGNLIDLSFIEMYNISAVLYSWHGGQEGANALVDILEGRVSPAGKLPDTQVYDVSKYPSLRDFGNTVKLIYSEDIYVGYRYFETFKPEQVQFPFGFGLTYSNFSVSCSVKEENGIIKVLAKVENTGHFKTREVVQVYFGAPCGKLGTPVKQLAGFAKTKNLVPGECETLQITFPISQMAAYDDSGVTGNKSCYVLESGVYKIFVGTDIRTSKEIFSYSVNELIIVESLEEIMSGDISFERVKAIEKDGQRAISYEQSPMKQNDLDKRIFNNRIKEIPSTGDKGIKLLDVADGKNSIEEFVAQMTDEDLSSIVCGEGMDSPKVTPGTAGAFGGVTNRLLSMGIPTCCVADGPSGIRIGNNYKTTSLPIGYAFSSSFDIELAEKIFELEGIELFGYNIDAILGPGMNIHRHPLCGRNFEYFSEDPLLTGKIAAAQTRGVYKSGCSTTLKHFCCNNQEAGRSDVNVIVSERALREIYLKGFEIALKESNATAIMTSYNLVNGYHSASNYDLTTTVLRKEWGFKGFVMTDWWAKCNCQNQYGTKENLKAMIRAHNDIYMVCACAEEYPSNIKEGLNEGYILRSDLQYCAINILNYIMKSPTFEKFVFNGAVVQQYEALDETELNTLGVIDNPENGQHIKLDFGCEETVLFLFEVVSNTDLLAQSKVEIFINGITNISFIIGGTNNQIINIKRKLKIAKGNHDLEFCIPNDVKIKRITIMQ